MNENDFCCIKRVIKSISITVPTKYISNEIAAVSEILEGWKRQYVPKLQGVVVNYRNIRLSTRTVVVHASRTAPKCVVTATFDLFCPTVGEIVKGTINRISREHIGCLIEGTINVSIHRKKQAPPDLTKYIKLHQSILFEIESFSYDRQTIRVKGNITPECCELMKEVFPICDSGSAQVVNGFPLKDESTLSDDLFSNTESAFEDAVNNLESKVEETLNNVTKSPKKKSKKRKHERESPSVEHNEKKLKLSDPKPSHFAVNGGSELQEKVNELSESPKPKSLKRKRESETSPVVKPIKKPKPSNSDPSDAADSSESSDHEKKSPSKKILKKLKSESPKKGTDTKVVIPKSSDDDSSGSSSSSDDSDHGKTDVNNILTKSPSKKLLKNLKSERESPPKGIGKNKVISKSSDDDSSDSSSSGDDADHDKMGVNNILTSPSKKVLKNLKSETSPRKGSDKKKKKHKSGDKREKKKSKKKDRKPKLKKKSKVLAAGDVLKKDKKKSKKNKTGKKDIKKKDKKDKKKSKKKEKKDKTKDSKSIPVKIKSEFG